MSTADTSPRLSRASRSRTPVPDGLRHFRGDAIEGAVMRGNIRGRLFGQDDSPPLPEIGPLVLRKQLGRGGMGVVYAAYDRRLRREVALKLISLGRRPAAAGLLEEARAIAAIDHENVVRVFSAGRCVVPGEDDARVYIAMERIRGLTLRRWIVRRSPSVTAIVAAYCQAARGLAAAHRAGITHGDFKPDNAMIDDATIADATSVHATSVHGGRVRTMDFGLAVRREPTTAGDGDVTTSTPPVELAGTPGYMAPELMYGEPPSPHSDQWALCASLVEGLLGALPSTMSEAALVRALAKVGLDARQIGALRRGLARDPAMRFPSTDALADALTPRHPRRRLIAALGASVVGVIAIAAWPSAPTSCDAIDRLTGAWDEPTRATVQRSFVDAGVDGTAAVAAIEDYAAALSTAMHGVCEASRAAAVVPEERHACLERRRRGLAAVVDALREPDARRLAHAQDAIERLPAIDACDGEGEPWPMPQDAALARAVGEARGDLAAAAAAAVLGGALTPLVDLRERAVILDHPPLLAEVEVELGRHEAVLGDSAIARARLERGHAIALAQGMDDLAARAALDLAMHAVQVQGDVDTATRWIRAAEAEASAAMAPALLEVRYELAVAENHLDAALAIAEQQRDDAASRCPEGCGATILALHELAHASWMVGRSDDALVYAQRGETLARQRLGSLHDQTLSLAQLRADISAELGDRAEAARVLEDVLALRSNTAAPGSVLLVSTRFALAQAYAGMPEHAADAQALYEQVLADAERTGNDHFVGMASAELAGVGFRRGEIASALAFDRRAIDAFERAHGDAYPQLATLLGNHSAHLLAAGDGALALDTARRAWALWKAASPEPTPQDAALLHHVARALLAQGRADEAMVSLQQAIDVTADAPASGASTLVRIAMADVLASRGRGDEATRWRDDARRRCAALDQPRAIAAKCAVIDADVSPATRSAR